MEVLSRSTEVRDRGRKKAILARFAVPEYWIVDPTKNTSEIYVLREAKYEFVGVFDKHQTIQSATFADLSFPAARVFAE